jgi:hypothetical protein
MKKIFLFILMFVFSIYYTHAFSGSGDGTGSNPFQVTDCLQLQEIELNLTASYIVMNNINCNDTINWNGGAGFIPISSFSGSFGGRDYVISKLYIYDTRSYPRTTGLFGWFGPGTISNVFLEDVNITGSHGSYSCDVGGLVGFQNGGIISGSHVTGSVKSGIIVGGLVGNKNQGIIINSYSAANVVGDRDVGGLTGYNYGPISNSYSIGNVTGNSYVGGLIGSNRGGVVNSYSVGRVVGGGSYVGGLAGRDTGGFTNSYWNNETSNQNTSAGGEGKTTAEMKQQATFVDWDFANIWTIDGGVTYPDLITEEHLECLVDSDCGLCDGCEFGLCVVQPMYEDLKDECPISFNACLNNYTLQGPGGFCGGHMFQKGVCDVSSGAANVSVGNVCINGTDTNPTSGVNCGIWKNCIYENTFANEYYVGYIGDGTDTCIDTDWQPTGTIWNASVDYYVKTTEHAETCQEWSRALGWAWSGSYGASEGTIVLKNAVVSVYGGVISLAYADDTYITTTWPVDVEGYTFYTVLNTGDLDEAFFFWINWTSRDYIIVALNVVTQTWRNVTFGSYSDDLEFEGVNCISVGEGYNGIPNDAECYILYLNNLTFEIQGIMDGINTIDNLTYFGGWIGFIGEAKIYVSQENNWNLPNRPPGGTIEDSGIWGWDGYSWNHEIIHITGWWDGYYGASMIAESLDGHRALIASPIAHLMIYDNGSFIDQGSAWSGLQIEESTGRICMSGGWNNNIQVSCMDYWGGNDTWVAEVDACVQIATPESCETWPGSFNADGFDCNANTSVCAIGGIMRSWPSWVGLIFYNHRVAPIAIGSIITQIAIPNPVAYGSITTWSAIPTHSLGYQSNVTMTISGACLDVSYLTYDFFDVNSGDTVSYPFDTTQFNSNANCTIHTVAYFTSGDVANATDIILQVIGETEGELGGLICSNGLPGRCTTYLAVPISPYVKFFDSTLVEATTVNIGKSITGAGIACHLNKCYIKSTDNYGVMIKDQVNISTVDLLDGAVARRVATDGNIPLFGDVNQDGNTEVVWWGTDGLICITSVNLTDLICANTGLYGFGGVSYSGVKTIWAGIVAQSPGYSFTIGKINFESNPPSFQAKNFGEVFSLTSGNCVSNPVIVQCGRSNHNDVALIYYRNDSGQKQATAICFDGSNFEVLGSFTFTAEENPCKISSIDVNVDAWGDLITSIGIIDIKSQQIYLTELYGTSIPIDFNSDGSADFISTIGGSFWSSMNTTFFLSVPEAQRIGVGPFAVTKMDCSVNDYGYLTVDLYGNAPTSDIHFIMDPGDDTDVYTASVPYFTHQYVLSTRNYTVVGGICNNVGYTCAYKTCKAQVMKGDLEVIITNPITGWNDWTSAGGAAGIDDDGMLYFSSGVPATYYHDFSCGTTQCIINFSVMNSGVDLFDFILYVGNDMAVDIKFDDGNIKILKNGEWKVIATYMKDQLKTYSVLVDKEIYKFWLTRDGIELYAGDLMSHPKSLYNMQVGLYYSKGFIKIGSVYASCAGSEVLVESEKKNVVYNELLAKGFDPARLDACDNNVTFYVSARAPENYTDAMGALFGYCRDKKNTHYCSISDLSDTIKYNKNCFKEAMNYCVLVTYPTEHGGISYNSGEGTVVCFTSIGIDVFTGQVVLPMIKNIYEMIRINLIPVLILVVLLIIIFSIIGLKKAR